MPEGDFQKVVFAGEPTPAAAIVAPVGDKGVIDTNVNTNNDPPPAATPDPNRPSWLPEKFASAEDMAKAYGELEKKLGSKPADPPPANTPDPAQILTPSAAELDVFSDEYAKNGKLSDETYAKLEKDFKLPKALVDNFINGQLAISEKHTNEIHSAAGGKENYTKMLQWASTNLTPTEVAAYDNIMSGGDLEAVKLAAKGLYAQYTSKMGSDPKLVHGDGSTTGDNEGYQSRAEMVVAMQDPRYQKDPAYRKAVAYKISKSTY